MQIERDRARGLRVAEHPALSHPDSDRRLRNRTGSADLARDRPVASARGLDAARHHRRWGIPPRP